MWCSTAAQCVPLQAGPAARWRSARSAHNHHLRCPPTLPRARLPAGCFLCSLGLWARHYWHTYYTIEYVAAFLLVTTLLLPFILFLSMAGEQAVLPGAGGFPYTAAGAGGLLVAGRVGAGMAGGEKAPAGPTLAETLRSLSWHRLALATAHCAHLYHPLETIAGARPPFMQARSGGGPAAAPSTWRPARGAAARRGWAAAVAAAGSARGGHSRCGSLTCCAGSGTRCCQMYWRAQGASERRRSSWGVCQQRLEVHRLGMSRVESCEVKGSRGLGRSPSRASAGVARRAAWLSCQPACCGRACRRAPCVCMFVQQGGLWAPAIPM